MRLSNSVSTVCRQFAFFFIYRCKKCQSRYFHLCSQTRATILLQLKHVCNFFHYKKQSCMDHSSFTMMDNEKIFQLSKVNDCILPFCTKLSLKILTGAKFSYLEDNLAIH